MRSPGLRAICYFRFAPRKGIGLCQVQRKAENAAIALVGKIRRDSAMRIKRNMAKDRYAMGRVGWRRVMGFE